MEKLKEIGTYFQLVNQVHKDNTAIFTNCYLYPKKIEKLISQGRFCYEEINAGVIFLVDEKEYYEAYYVLCSNKEWSLKPKDKDIVINNIYMKDKKSEKLKLLEKQLEKNGFLLKETFGHIKCDAQVISRKLGRFSEVANRLMKENNLSLVAPDYKLVPQIRGILESLDTISNYQIPYFREEEIIEFGKEGRFICIINEKRELCAVKFYREEDSLYGTIAIKEEYQKAYGIAVILYCHLPGYMKGKDLKPEGWIATVNTESIKYHMNLGYYWTGRYMDEWVLGTG